MRIKVGGKAIAACFLIVEGRETLIGAIGAEREGQIEESVGGQNPDPELSPMSKIGQERREQRRCQERSNCQMSDGKGWVCQGH